MNPDQQDQQFDQTQPDPAQDFAVPAPEPQQLQTDQTVEIARDQTTEYYAQNPTQDMQQQPAVDQTYQQAQYVQEQPMNPQVDLPQNSQFDVPVAETYQQAAPQVSYDQQPASPQQLEPAYVEKASFQQPVQTQYQEPAPQYQEPQPVQEPYVAPATPVATVPVSDGYGAGTTYTSVQPKKSKLPIVLGILGLFFFAFLMYGAYLVFGRNSDPAPEVQDTTMQQDQDAVIDGVTEVDRELLKNAFTNSIKRQSRNLNYQVTSELGTTDFDLDIDYSDVNDVVLVGTATLNSSDTEGASTFSIVVPGDDLVYVKIDEFDEPDLQVPEDDLNVWFTHPQQFSDITEEQYDFLVDDETAQIVSFIAGEISPLATTADEIPRGNFTQDQQNELLALYDEQTPYDVTASESETVDGTGYKILTATYDPNKLVPILEKMDEFSVDQSIQQFTTEAKAEGNKNLKIRINETTKNIESLETTDDTGSVTSTATNFDEEVIVVTPNDAVTVFE